MGKKSISIDIYLDEIEVDDLLEELEERYEEMSAFKKHSFRAIKPESRFRVKSLAEQMRYEFILKNFDKLSLAKLEKCIG